MQAWEEAPKSEATGILDDETYDWRAVVEGMLMTGGRPLVVSEDLLVEANRLAVSKTGIQVDPTGSSGLAGLLEMRRSGAIGDQDRRCAVHRNPAIAVQHADPACRTARRDSTGLRLTRRGVSIRRSRRRSDWQPKHSRARSPTANPVTKRYGLIGNGRGTGRGTGAVNAACT